MLGTMYIIYLNDIISHHNDDVLREIHMILFFFCVFCYDREESLDHVLFSFGVAKEVWGLISY